MQQSANLYLPGLRPDGTPRTLVALPGFWDKMQSDQKRGGRGDFYADEIRDQLGVRGIVQLDRIDNRTGTVLSRVLTHNVVTDNGAQALLKLFGSAGAGTLGQYFILDTASAASQVNSAITAATNLATAGITVVSGGNAGTVAGNKAAAFNGNTTNTPCTSGSAGSADTVTGGGVALGYGLGTVDYASASTTMTATNIGVATGTCKNAHALNEWVVANPQTGDGVTAFTGGIIYNSAASTSGATGTTIAGSVSGTGIGSRQVVMTATFNTSSTAGSYTGLWIATFATIAAATAAGCYSHLSFNPQTINGSTSLQVTYTVRI